MKQPDTRDAGYLWDIATAARAIQNFVTGMSYVDYEEDAKTKSAVERQVEIIGEAARRISQNFKEEHPEIPWRKMIGQRTILTHQYDEIADNLIWEIATLHIPSLLRQIEPLIPPLPKEIE